MNTKQRRSPTKTQGGGFFSSAKNECCQVDSPPLPRATKLLGILAPIPPDIVCYKRTLATEPANQVAGDTVARCFVNKE